MLAKKLATSGGTRNLKTIDRKVSKGQWEMENINAGETLRTSERSKGDARSCGLSSNAGNAERRAAVPNQAAETAQRRRER